MAMLPRYTAIVRRGELATYAELGKTRYRVMWDRRFAERRVRPSVPPEAIERRGRERRGLVPRRWETMGFMIVSIE
jgi:hypothetical protein